MARLSVLDLTKRTLGIEHTADDDLLEIYTAGALAAAKLYVGREVTEADDGAEHYALWQLSVARIAADMYRNRGDSAEFSTAESNNVAMKYLKLFRLPFITVREGEHGESKSR